VDPGVKVNKESGFYNRSVLRHTRRNMFRTGARPIFLGSLALRNGRPTPRI